MHVKKNHSFDGSRDNKRQFDASEKENRATHARRSDINTKKSKRASAEESVHAWEWDMAEYFGDYDDLPRCPPDMEDLAEEQREKEAREDVERKEQNAHRYYVKNYDKLERIKDSKRATKRANRYLPRPIPRSVQGTILNPSGWGKSSGASTWGSEWGFGPGSNHHSCIQRN